jgi:demethylmenaquinone methyltransferase/2-methoxy-6-polyprenyl-1,4-benzoquinol methylase
MQYSVIGSEVKDMFGSIAGRYDLTNTVLSFGIHHYWRYRLTRLLPARKDALVLDLCTGTGDLIAPLANRFGSVIGADFCLPMLESGRGKLARKGQGHAPLVQSDALNLPFKEASFDIVTVAFGVRNFENLERGLKEIRRTIKPGGHLLVLEFGQPTGVVWGSLFRFYSRVVMPFVGGLLTGNREAYSYLPRTASQFPCGDDFGAILTRCGFTPRRAPALTGGIAYAYLAERQG